MGFIENHPTGKEKPQITRITKRSQNLGCFPEGVPIRLMAHQPNAFARNNLTPSPVQREHLIVGCVRMISGRIGFAYCYNALQYPCREARL